MFKRAAIQAKGMVVLDRNSQANLTFPSAPLRRAKVGLAPAHPFETCHHQPLGLRGPASCTLSPKWLGPGRASTWSSSS